MKLVRFNTVTSFVYINPESVATVAPTEIRVGTANNKPASEIHLFSGLMHIVTDSAELVRTKLTEA